MNRHRWQHSNVRLRYDRRTDTFFVHALPIVPAGGIYVGPQDEALLLVTDQKEIVGMQLENFRSLWLKRHPEAPASLRWLTLPFLSHILPHVRERPTSATIKTVKKAGYLNIQPAH